MLDTRTEPRDEKTKPTHRSTSSEKREAARRSAEKWVTKRRKTRVDAAPRATARFVGATGII